MPQAVGAVASIGGAILGKKAAGDAASAQRSSAIADMNLQRETRDIMINRVAPWYTGGQTAQAALDYELGLGAAPMIGGTAPKIETIQGVRGRAPAASDGGAAFTNGTGINALARGLMAGTRGSPTTYRVNGQTFQTMEEAQAYANANKTGGTAYGGYTKTPGYDFRMKTGLDAIEASAGARGGLYSGAAMQDALKYGQDYASNEYGNYLSRLGARADTGLGAATLSNSATQNAANNMSNALGNAGNAAAAGSIGGYNAVTGGMNNLAGLWNYQRNLNQPGGVTVGSNFFGGNSWG